MTAREQARYAVAEALMMGRAAATTRGRRAADAASDVWEPIAKTLRDHVPTRHTIVTTPHSPSIYCGRCNTLWPCPEWRKASKALDD